MIVNINILNEYLIGTATYIDYVVRHVNGKCDPILFHDLTIFLHEVDFAKQR